MHDICVKTLEKHSLKMQEKRNAKNDYKHLGTSEDTLNRKIMLANGNVISEKCKTRLSTIAALVILGFIMMSVLTISLNSPATSVHVILIQRDTPVESTTSSKFLSVALDSSIIAEGFKKFDMTSKKLKNMVRNLSPGYLRIGGTMADRLIFIENNSSSMKVFTVEQDGSECAYEEKLCAQRSRHNFTLSRVEWLKLYNFASTCGFTILFDLNCLLRYPDGSWDFENGEELIKFSNDNNMNVIWQLGNEPNSLGYVFNESVNATQLAKDFSKLRSILNKYPMYQNTMLIGPDVTRPRPEDRSSFKYLREFLESGGGNGLDAITFHQYYFNGRTVISYDFLDPKVYDTLRAQIDLVKSLVNYYEINPKPVWLSETSDAYGGGAPGYSNRYIGTFIWLDKLGLAAKMGLAVVVRQTLFKGFYALIDDNYDPTPNYWISAVYKAFVGPEVIPCIEATSSKVRLYCQCTNRNFKTSYVTLFGVNVKDTDAIIRIEGLKDSRHPLGTIYSYVISPHLTLLSKNVYLNKELLTLGTEGELPPFKPTLITDDVHVVIPAYSSAFFVIPTVISACQ